MAPAFQTVAVSLVYLLWSACQRMQQPPAAAPAQADQPPGGDEQVEYRLDCLTVLVKPSAGHRR